MELGVVAFSYRVPGMLVGAAVEDELQGAGALWFPDRHRGFASRETWRQERGILSEVVRDPDSYADPFVACAAALMATRKARAGVLAVDLPWRGASAVALAASTLAALAPGRFSLGVAVTSESWEVSEEVKELAVTLGTERPELVVTGCSATAASVAGSTGDSWLALARPGGVTQYAERIECLRRAADDAGRDPRAVKAGILLRCVAHHDSSVVEAALGSPLVRLIAHEHLVELGETAKVPGGAATSEDMMLATATPEAAAKVLVHGTPRDVVDQLLPFTEANVDRVVLENLVVLGAPSELRAGEEAAWSVLRLIRMAVGAMNSRERGVAGVEIAHPHR